MNRQLAARAIDPGGMHRTLASIAFVSFVSLSSLSLLGSGCAPDQPSADTPSAPDSERCQHRFLPPAVTGFAVHVSGEVVAFEPATGRELARSTLGSQIADLAWDARTRRLLVVTDERFDREGSRIQALALEDGKLAVEASSEILPGELRIVPTPERVLAIGADLTVDWYELDDDLAIVTSSDLPRPETAWPYNRSLFALRREPQADVAFRVGDFDAGWTRAELAVPRLEPERAITIAASGASLWLVRHANQRLELAELDAESFPPAAPPEFETIDEVFGSGAGPLRALELDPVGCALVGVADTTVALAPLVRSQARAVALVALHSSLARRELWIGRNLVVDPAARRAFVATEIGVEARELDHALDALAGFDGSELRAPLALAR